MHDASQVYHQSWKKVRPDSVIYNSPYDKEELKSNLSAYQEVETDMTLFAEGREFLHIKQTGWIATEYTSEEDNVCKSVQELFISNTRMNSFQFYKNS